LTADAARLVRELLAADGDCDAKSHPFFLTKKLASGDGCTLPSSPVPGTRRSQPFSKTNLASFGNDVRPPVVLLR
jgi:hypothetical protein